MEERQNYVIQKGILHAAEEAFVDEPQKSQGQERQEVKTKKLSRRELHRNLALCHTKLMSKWKESDVITIDDSDGDMRKSNVLAHLKPAVVSASFNCGVIGCQLKFDKKYKLQDHMRLKHNQAKLKCMVKCCNIEKLTQYSLYHHVNKDHKKKNVCKEEKCGKSFLTAEDLEKHLKSMHKKKGNVIQGLKPIKKERSNSDSDFV